VDVVYVARGCCDQDGSLEEGCHERGLELRVVRSKVGYSRKPLVQGSESDCRGIQPPEWESAVSQELPRQHGVHLTLVNKPLLQGLYCWMVGETMSLRDEGKQTHMIAVIVFM
jgi:hypothetical protein